VPFLKRRKSGEGVEYTSCRLCRRAYKSITCSHLVRKHHFDPEHPVEEYKAKFRLRVATSFESCELRRKLRVGWLERHGRRLTRKQVIHLLRKERGAGRSLLATRVLGRYHSLHHSAVRHFGSWPDALGAAGLEPDVAQRARVWGREKVLAGIRSIPRSTPLNKVGGVHPRLCAAALRYFGGWPAAVKAAGCVYPPPGGPWKWTRDRILKEIRARARQGASIRRGHIFEELPGLVESACLLFGDWRATVREAGFEDRLPPLGRHWTRQELCQLLREVRKERETVTYAVLAKIDRPGLVCPVTSVQRHFGTLSRARMAAGLPAREWRSRIWNRSRVLDVVRSRVKKGLPIGLGSVQDKMGGLVTAAKRYFGDWRATVAAAGAAHLLRPPLRRWTRAAVLSEIRSLVRAGHSIDQKDLYKERPGFVHTATRRFGSWSQAVAAANCSSHLTPALRHWTREELIHLLRSFWRRTGRLSSEVIKGHKRPGFMGAMYSVTKVFGSFPAAKRAARLGHVATFQQIWTKGTIVRELRERARRGRSVRSTHLKAERGGFEGAARREFGSWKAALRAAGVAEPSPFLKWTRERMLGMIRAIAKRGLLRDQVALTKMKLGGLRQLAAQRFGSWDAAIEAAGVPVPAFSYVKWTRETVIETLRKEARRGRSLAWKKVGRKYGGLPGAARRLFGRWSGALQAAGCHRLDRRTRVRA
jgi:hypothetical protein